MARVLITGCSSGIGNATARLLAARGHEVTATARDLAGIADLPVARHLALDVTDAASVANAAAMAGEVDVLINNAGLAMWGPTELCDIERVDRLMQTNVLGVVRMAQAVLPGMRARRSGRIIQISSGAARRPQPLVGLYCASKAALESLSLALRIEMRPFGVKVAVVGMGAIHSNIDRNRWTADAAGTDYAPMMGAMLDRVGTLRAQAYSAEEAAEVVASVVEAEDPPFRTYVGAAFAAGLAEMAALDDAAYEERLLATYLAT